MKEEEKKIQQKWTTDSKFFVFLCMAWRTLGRARWSAQSQRKRWGQDTRNADEKWGWG